MADSLPAMGVVGADAAPVSGGQIASSSISAGQSVQMIQQQNLTGASAVMQGIQQARAQDAAQTDAIMGLVKGAVAPMIKDEQDRAYLQGQARVMQGETAKDIIDQQPWYSSIFGKDATAQGAAYQGAMDQANQTSVALLANSDENRKMSPSEYQQKFINTVLTSTTGDPDMDRMYREQMMHNSQSMYDQQYKANFKYVQDENQKASAKRMQGTLQFHNATILNSKAEGTPLSADSQAAIDEQLIQSFMPLPGQTEESWNKAMMGAMLDAANTGNLHSLNLIQKSAIWGKLSPEDQDKITARRTAYETGHYKEMAGRDLNDQFMNLKENYAYGKVPGKTQAEKDAYLIHATDNLNKQFRDRTGAQRDFIDPQETSAQIGKAIEHVYRKEELRANEAQRAANSRKLMYEKDALEERHKQEKLADGVADYMSGNAGAYSHGYAGMDEPTRQEVARQVTLKLSNGDPDQSAKLLVQNGQVQGLSANSEILKPFKTMIKDGIDAYQYSHQISPNLAKAIDLGKRMIVQPGGEAVLNKYDPQLAQIVKAASAHGADVPLSNIVETTLNVDHKAFSDRLPEEKKDIQERGRDALKSEAKARYPGLSDEQYSHIADMGGSHVRARAGRNVSPEISAKEYIDTYPGEVVGGQLVDMHPGQNSAIQALGYGQAAGAQDRLDTDFHETVLQALKEQTGITDPDKLGDMLETAHVIRHDDQAEGNNPMKLPQYSIHFDDPTRQDVIVRGSMILKTKDLALKDRIGNKGRLSHNKSNKASNWTSNFAAF